MSRYTIGYFAAGTVERIYVNGVTETAEKVYLHLRGGRLHLVAPGLDPALVEGLLHALHDAFGVPLSVPDRDRFVAFKEAAATRGRAKPSATPAVTDAHGRRPGSSAASVRQPGAGFGATRAHGQDFAFENIRNARPIRIEVDHREPAEIVEHLRRVQDCEVVVTALDVADFRLNDGRILVERKSVRDFALSVQSHHIFDQAQRMGFEPGAVCVVIIEGNVFGEPLGMLDSQITGAISCLSNVQGMSVFQTKNPEHTAYVLAKFAQHERNGLGYELTLRQRKPAELLDAQRYVLEGFNGITTTLADRLLTHFGSVRSVLLASIAELREVDGIGPKRAEQIHTLINAPYRQS